MNELAREDFVHFCGNLEYRLKLLAQNRLHTDRLLATRFNVFQYIQPDENGLSDIIADLMRPDGKHGQGAAFLGEFVKMIGGLAPAAWASGTVWREHATTSISRSRRRLDVLIELGTFAIAIENKPWAAEQDEQLGDYVSHLERKFSGNFVMVYLSPDGVEPESIDPARRERLLQEKKLVLCAYNGRFHEWLTRCRQLCDAEKMRWFLSDFSAYIEQTFPAKNLTLTP